MLFFSLLQINSPAEVPHWGCVDEKLISAIAGGDKQALEQLYTQSKTAVYGFALSVLKNAPAAEDVMQDTYIRIYQAAGQYRPQGKPMAWILTITRNLALMRLRENKKEALPLQEDWQMADSFNSIENSTDRIVLRALLDRLGDGERQIILLHVLSGLKHREIAALLDMPLATVLSKYRRGLAKLKKQVEEQAQ